MLISPLTPLFFPPVKTDGIEGRYVQTFAYTDEILVQLLGLPSEQYDFHVFSEPDHAELPDIGFEDIEMGDKVRFIIAKITLPPGFYSVEIDGRRSDIFKVTDDSRELEDTVLIQYSPEDNRRRKDVVAIANGTRMFFSFRIPGGFKDSGWSFSVDNEQFVTNDGDIIELYGMESTQKVLTVGGSQGVPVWFGQMLNRILTCRYVYIDGVRYARFESSVPQKEQVLEGVNSFVFSQTLQEIKNLEPHIGDVKI